MTAGLAKMEQNPFGQFFQPLCNEVLTKSLMICLLNNVAGTILVYGASAYGMNDESHLGIFDIPFLSHIPNLVYLAPTNKEEYLAMLDWSH